MTAEAEPLVIFTPSGRRGHFPTGTTVLDAARSLGVDIDSVCGGRGICGRCQVTQGLGEFPKHGITSSAGNLSPFAELETAYREEKGLAADRRLSCTADGLRRRPRRRAAREPGPSPGRPQGPRRPDVHGGPGRPAPLRRGRAARAGLADRRPRPPVRGARARMAADGPRRGPRGRPRAPARAGGREVPRHGGRPRGAPGHRRLAGPPRQGLRRRHRRRAPPRSPGTSRTWPTGRSSRATAS